MAMSGGTAKLVHSATPSGWPGPIQLYVYYKTTQNSSTNQSTITCGMYVTTPSGWYTETWGDFNGSYVGTTALAFDGTAAVSGTKWLVENKSFTVNHSSDGTGKAVIYWKWGVYADQSWISGFANPSGSFSITLPTIARASTIASALDITLGSKCSVQFTPASTSFYYNLTFSLGNWSTNTGLFCPGTISAYTYNSLTISNTTSHSGSTLYSQMTKSTGAMTVTLTTYSSNSTSAQIGSTSSKTFTVTIPSSVKPTVGTITLSPQTYSYLIQNKNKVKVSVTGCSAGEGSSIKSYTFSGPGLSTTTTSTSATSNVTSSTGTLTYTVTVTDNRDRSASKTDTITCYEYSSPSFSSFNVYRCDANGTADTSGTYIRCSYGLNRASVGGTNKVSVKVWYKTLSASTYSNSTPILSDSTVTSGTSNALSGFDISTTYTVYATITDSYGGSANSSIESVFSEERVFNVLADGSGIAIGKMASVSGTLDCKWPIYTDNPEVTLHNFSHRGAVVGSDTISNWIAQGNLATGVFGADTSSIINGAPANAGFLLNLTNMASDVHHIWAGLHGATNNNLYHRSGNASGLGPWKMLLDSDNCDYVVEAGLAPGTQIRYCKWKNGQCVAWYRQEFGEIDLTVNAASGVYTNTGLSSRDITFPSGLFYETPTAVGNVCTNGYTFCQVSDVTKDKMSYRVWAPYSCTVKPCTVNIVLMGLWHG